MELGFAHHRDEVADAHASRFFHDPGRQVGEDLIIAAGLAEDQLAAEMIRSADFDFRAAESAENLPVNFLIAVARRGHDDPDAAGVSVELAPLIDPGKRRFVEVAGREADEVAGGEPAVIAIGDEAALVAVLPEGVMINYLSRRENPTPYTNLMVPELLTFGEDVIQRRFEMTPPDYILLVHKDMKEYGVPYFGSDPRNGKALMDWIGTRYTQVEVIGRTPLRDGGYGIAILKARQPACE